MRQRHAARLRQGATAVEFAMTVPILLMLVFGFIEMTRMYNISGLTRNVVFLTARKASLSSSTPEEVVAFANRRLNALGIPSVNVVLDPPSLDASEITVRIDVPLDTSNGFLAPWFVTGKTVSQSMTREREISSRSGNLADVAVN